MVFKYIIQTVIIMVIALLIFSYIVDSSTKYKVNQFFTNAKGKLSSSIKENIEKIPTPEKTECEEKASNLVPEYLVLPYNNFWKDNTPMGLNNPSIRKGSTIGENINKIYFDGNLTYSKEIISRDGVILGTRTFLVKPYLEKYDIDFKINHTLDFTKETRTRGSREESRYLVDTTIFWEGFNEEVKEIFKINKINVTFIRAHIIHQFIIDTEKGKESFSGYISDFVVWYDNQEYHRNVIENNQPPYYYSKAVKMFLDWKTFPLPVLDSEVYKIVNYEVHNCNWVEE